MRNITPERIELERLQQIELAFERLQKINAALVDKANGYVIANARLAEQAEALRADAERIEHLESLMQRTQFQNNKRPTESVGSDLHMGGGRCALYVRDLFGNAINAECGHDESVRAAIDAARGQA